MTPIWVVRRQRVNHNVIAVLYNLWQVIITCRIAEHHVSVQCAVLGNVHIYDCI
jgi:hypothetical protein